MESRPDGYRQDTSLTTARADREKAQADLAIATNRNQQSLADVSRAYGQSPELSNVPKLLSNLISADGGLGKTSSLRNVEARLAEVIQLTSVAESNISGKFAETDKQIEYKNPQGQATMVSLAEMRALQKELAIVVENERSRTDKKVQLDNTEVRYQQARASAEFDLLVAKKQAAATRTTAQTATDQAVRSRDLQYKEASISANEYNNSVTNNSFGDLGQGLSNTIDTFTSELSKIATNQQERLAAAKLTYDSEIDGKKSEGPNDPIFKKAQEVYDASVFSINEQAKQEKSALLGNSASKLVSSLKSMAEAIDKGVGSLVDIASRSQQIIGKINTDRNLNRLETDGRQADLRNRETFSYTGSRETNGPDGKVTIDQQRIGSIVYDNKKAGQRQAAEVDRDYTINRGELESLSRKIAQASKSVNGLGSDSTVATLQQSDSFTSLPDSLQRKLAPMLANTSDVTELKRKLTEALATMGDEVAKGLADLSDDFRLRARDRAMLATRRQDKSRVTTISDEANSMDIELENKKYRSLLTGDGNKDRERTKVNLALEASLLTLADRKEAAQQRLANGTGSQDEIDALDELKSRFIERAKEAYDSVGTGWTDVINTAFSNIGLAEAIKKGIDNQESIESIFKQIGQNLFQSIADSFLKSAEKGIGDMVSNLLKDILGRATLDNSSSGSGGGLITSGLKAIGIDLPHFSMGGSLGSDGNAIALPSYAAGNTRANVSDSLADRLAPGNQEPRGAAQLAVINSGELVLPAEMSREFLRSRSEANRAVTSVVSNQSTYNNQSNQSTVTYNSTSNYQPAGTDTFGVPRQVVDQDSQNRRRFAR